MYSLWPGTPAKLSFTSRFGAAPVPSLFAGLLVGLFTGSGISSGSQTLGYAFGPYSGVPSHLLPPGVCECLTLGPPARLRRLLATVLCQAVPVGCSAAYAPLQPPPPSPAL